METKALMQAIIVLTTIIALSGCDRQVQPSQALPGQAMPSGAKIQINVPDEPYPATRTKLITYDVDDGRGIFVQLFDSTKRVGMCSPDRIEKSTGAHEAMSVSYWGDVVEHRVTFHILKNEKGEWITTGYGGVEIYDHPEGFPEYRYSPASLSQVKAWYEKHIPQSDRRR